MKRYFLVPPGELPSEQPDPPHIGEYHFIDLDSHGPNGAGYRALVLMEASKAAPDSWIELPHLLDAVSTLATTDAAIAASAPAPVIGTGTTAPAPPSASQLLSDVGATSAQSGYALAQQLATIHPLFKP